MPDETGPLDGIIEEEPAKKVVASPDAEQSNGRVTSIGPTSRGRSTIQDVGTRQLWEADVTAIQHQLKTLQAMILALRSVVGAAALAAIIALLQTRKLQKRVAELEGKPAKKVIDIEAKTPLEAVEVGD